VERAAFSRARRFLNYSPAAKWSALVAAAGTAVFYVVLLILLGLFVDLIVHRGEITAYQQLSPVEQKNFRDNWEDVTPLFAGQVSSKAKDIPAAAQETLKALGIEDGRLKEYAQFCLADPKTLTPAQRDLRLELLWRVHVAKLLEDRVGAEAADLYRKRFAADVHRVGSGEALFRDVPDMGALGLAVRTEHRLDGWLVAWLASWNGWMWAHGYFAYLTGLLVVAIVLAFLRGVLVFVGHYMAAQATIAATTRLRRAVYHQTYRLGTLAFRALGPSEAVGVSTRHLEAVHDGLYAWLTVVFREPVKFVLLLVFAMMVNFLLATAFLLFALLVWLIGGQIAAYFRRQGRQDNHRAADQLALVQESLMLMRLVKVYLMEVFNQARVERQMSKYAGAQRRRYLGEAIYRPLLVFMGLVAALVLLYVAGFTVLSGQIGVTSCLVLATALVSLYFPLANWLETRRFLRRGRESAIVLFNFLDRAGGVGQGAEAEFLPALSKQLEFDNVTLNEPGTGRKLLQGVSLTIQAGQRVALVGPEDTEKYALVYLLPRFLDPTSGEIRVDRKNLRWVTLDSLRAQIAVVLQHNLVFNDTVANNIGCGDPAFTLPRIIEAAKTAHAHQFIQKLPQGYETPIGEMGHPLKQGEMFRIALARAILRDPALFVVEEPTVPLDEDTKSLLDDTFARVLPGRTTIFLPHRLSTIRHCDKVFLLCNGRIEAAGEHKELLAQNDLYRHLQYLEFNEFAGMTSSNTPAAAAAGKGSP
jgi:ATP-binding cassette subfamily B protein